MLNGWGPKISSVQDQQFTDYKGDKVTLKANPDNVKDFYETGMSYINNVSVAGGGEKADFRLSFTSTNQTGVVPNIYVQILKVVRHRGQMIATC